MWRKHICKDLVVFLFSAISIMLTINTGLGQVQFERPIQLSDSPWDSWNPNIAALDDQVFVFWRDQTSVPEERSEIRLAHSKDNGITFHIWNLSHELQESSSPQVISDGDYIYVGWPGLGDLSDPNTAGIYMSRSSDRGETFDAPFDLTRHGGYGIPIMRIQKGVVNAVWSGWSGSDWQFFVSDIFFAKSIDFGMTFTDPIRVSSNPREWGNAGAPRLIMDSTRVYILWNGKRPDSPWDDIYFARSLNGGESFCETVNLSQIIDMNERATSPQLAVGGQGYVYALWIQGLDALYPPYPYDIYFVRSTDGGETFHERLNLSNNPQGWNINPKVVAAGDNIYIVWNGLIEGTSNILFSRSTDGGETFSAPRNLSHTPGSAANAEIALIEKGQLLDKGIAEDVIYLVWQDGRTGYSEIFFSASLDGGATFSKPENVSNSRSYSGGPFIAAVRENIYITWMGTEAGHFKTFFTRGQLEVESKMRTLKTEAAYWADSVR